MQTPRSVINSYQPRVARRSRMLRVRGIDCHVTEWGDRRHPLLVFLHGWGDCGSTFQFVVDAFERPWFVAAPDWRGFGRSAPHAPAYWFADYLADLDAILTGYSPLRPVVLIGHSMGANVAALFSGALPERVATFINVEGVGLPDSDPADAPANYRRWIESGRQPVAYTGYPSLEALAKRIRVRNPRMSNEHALFVAAEWANAAADGTVRLRADPAHRLPNAVLYRRAEAESCWSRITARTLLLSGAESGYAAAAKAWFETTAGAPGRDDWQHLSVAEAGHMLHFDQPGRLAAAIEAFLLQPTL